MIDGLRIVGCHYAVCAGDAIGGPRWMAQSGVHSGRHVLQGPFGFTPLDDLARASDGPRCWF